MTVNALARATSPRRVRFTSKPFDPAVGKVGSWVRYGGITGQVWAEIDSRHVWVVTDDQQAYRCRKDALVPLVEVAQPDMLSVLQDAGRLEIVSVGASA